VEILHIAVPGAILLVGLAIAVFGWAVKHGQFDDLERQGMNILLDEAPKKSKKEQPGADDNSRTSDTEVQSKDNQTPDA